MCTLRGQMYKFLNNDVCLSLKVGLILENSADSDKMQHSAAFYLGLHCFQSVRLLGVSSIHVAVVDVGFAFMTRISRNTAMPHIILTGKTRF